MNLFFVDSDSVKAAQSLCDSHIRKMTVESGQMLSTVHRLMRNDITYENPINAILYKATHANHPSVKWTMESKANYDWHYQHFVALCDEYTYRFNKTHLTDTKLRYILQKSPDNLVDIGLTPFKLGMRLQPKEIVENDPVETYRNFYSKKQYRFQMIWTKRGLPDWFRYGDASSHNI